MFRHILPAIALFALSALPAQAQGLIWNLPEDGTWVRYEGSYRQVEAQPGSTEGNLEMEWIRHLTIKSVGREEADWNGAATMCRWIEIKVETGRVREGVISTGSVGERIYKVLVPEQAIIGSLKDEEGIPVTYLPIAKGWRKTNDRDPAPREITSGTLQVYPVISLLRHYKTMEAAPSQESVQVGQQDVLATKMTGSLELESRTERVVHESTLYRSDAVPFGLARWTVKVTQEEKGGVQERSEFQFVAETSVEMKAQEIGTDARSELVTP